MMMSLDEIYDWKERDLMFYSIRHYGITKQIKHGINPLTLAKTCGTSLKHLTETYYHVGLEEQKKEALVC